MNFCLNRNAVYRWLDQRASIILDVVSDSQSISPQIIKLFLCS